MRSIVSYGEEINRTQSEKRMHAYKVLREWPSAMEQLHLGQLYNSENGIHLGEKLWKNQQYSALNVYKNLVQNLEQSWKIFGMGGSFDKFSNEISTRLPIFLSFYEKESLHYEPFGPTNLK